MQLQPSSNSTNQTPTKVTDDNKFESLVAQRTKIVNEQEKKDFFISCINSVPIEQIIKLQNTEFLIDYMYTLIAINFSEYKKNSLLGQSILYLRKNLRTKPTLFKYTIEAINKHDASFFSTDENHLNNKQAMLNELGLDEAEVWELIKRIKHNFINNKIVWLITTLYALLLSIVSTLILGPTGLAFATLIFGGMLFGYFGARFLLHDKIAGATASFMLTAGLALLLFSTTGLILYLSAALLGVGLVTTIFLWFHTYWPNLKINDELLPHTMSSYLFIATEALLISLALGAISNQLLETPFLATALALTSAAALGSVLFALAAVIATCYFVKKYFDYKSRENGSNDELFIAQQSAYKYYSMESISIAIGVLLLAFTSATIIGDFILASAAVLMVLTFVIHQIKQYKYSENLLQNESNERSNSTSEDHEKKRLLEGHNHRSDLLDPTSTGSNPLPQPSGTQSASVSTAHDGLFGKISGADPSAVTNTPLSPSVVPQSSS